MNFQPPDIAPETHSAALPELPVYYLGDDGLLHEGAGLPGDGIWCKYSDVKAHLDSPAPSAESEGAVPNGVIAWAYARANGGVFTSLRDPRPIPNQEYLAVKWVTPLYARPRVEPSATEDAAAMRQYYVTAYAKGFVNSPLWHELADETRQLYREHAARLTPVADAAGAVQP